MKVSEKAAELRIAGWTVATEVRIRLLSADATSYAVADYIATRPNLNIVLIGEVKTGNGQLTPNQVLHYGDGLIQILSSNAAPLGLNQGDFIPAMYGGVDRYPGCPD